MPHVSPNLFLSWSSEPSFWIILSANFCMCDCWDVCIVFAPVTLSIMQIEEKKTVRVLLLESTTYGPGMESYVRVLCCKAVRHHIFARSTLPPALLKIRILQACIFKVSVWHRLSITTVDILHMTCIWQICTYRWLIYCQLLRLLSRCMTTFNWFWKHSIMG
jgi:hypothetical protein